MYLVMSLTRWEDVELENGVSVKDWKGSIGFVRVFATREAAEKAAKLASPKPAEVQELRYAVL